MKKRFALEFQVLDRKGIFGFLDQFQEDGDDTLLRGIVSLQTLRGRRIQQRWEEVDPHVNLAIFDEAGRLRNVRTLSSRVARLVRDGSDGLLLLTATPIQTSEQDLFNLLSLLDPDEFDNYELYRLRREANAHVLDSLRRLRAGTPEALRAAFRKVLSSM